MPSSMIHEHGWNGINFNSPFADMAILLGINWLAILLYVEAVVSPFGTGVSFVLLLAVCYALWKRMVIFLNS